MKGLEHWNTIIDEHPPLTHEEEGQLAQMRDESIDALKAIDEKRGIPERNYLIAIVDETHPFTAQQKRLLTTRNQAVETLIMHNLRDLVRKVEQWNWEDETEIHDLFMHAMEGMRHAGYRWKQVHKPGYDKPARFMHFSFLYVRDGIRRFCKKFGMPMISLDAPRGDDDNGCAYESFTGEVHEDDHDQLELSVVNDLPATQREIFTSRLMMQHDDTDADLAWACRIKVENINKHLYRAILNIMNATGHGLRSF